MTRLRLVSLTASLRADELLVGDASQGQFVVLPTIAGVMLDAMRAGEPLSQVAALARDATGDEVDVLDFASALIELGFVTHVDDEPIEAHRTRLHDGGRLGKTLSGLARPLFSRPAWILYTALGIFCGLLLLLQPRYRPHASSLFFLHDPLESVALLTAISSVRVARHEGAHWFAARVEGAPARITIGRRLYFLVAQTDLTSLLGLPRRRRFGALLAGLAFDVVVLALLLLAQVAATHNLWQPRPTVARLISAQVLLLLTGVAFQFLVFLRTDIYAVLVVGLNCVQLTHTTHLMIKRALGQLTKQEEEELAAADGRDLQIARWYRWLYLAGLVWATWFLVAFAIPWITTITRWILISLAHTPPNRWGFWESLLFAALALGPLILPGIMISRERLGGNRVALARDNHAR